MNMKLSAEDEEKFCVAAAILEKNREDTKQYESRTKGITNGNSERKDRALAVLLGK